MVANSDSFITVNRHRIIAAANRLRLPTIYSSAIQANSGGLLSYGADTEQQWQAAASYVDRILRGEKPRNLAVQQPAKFVLMINLKTAKALGLKIPESFLLRADAVIEYPIAPRARRLLQCMSLLVEGTTRTSRSPLDMSVPWAGPPWGVGD